MTAPREAGSVAALAAVHGDVQALPVSFAQRRFWLLDQLDEATAAYTLPFALACDGPLDADALAAAISLVVERHEALRTVFVLEGDEPVQVVLPPRAVPLPVEDLRPLGPDEAERRLAVALDENANRGFDLARGPLARFTLLRTADATHVWLGAFHHIVADGVSVALFLEEVREAYAARLAQRVQTFHGAVERLNLPGPLSTALKSLALAQGTTLFPALLAAFYALLHRYTQQDDLVIGSITAGRRRSEVEALIGLFMNTLAIRVDTGQAPSFSALVARVRDRVALALANQDIPFEQVVDAVQPERDRSRSPIFQVAFQLLEWLGREPALAGCTVHRVSAAKDTSKFDLTLMLMPAPGSALRAVLEYRSDLFDASTVDRMLGHYEALLTAAVREPSASITALPLMDDAEREAVLHAWNRTEAPIPAWTAPERILELSRTQPDAIAIEGEDRTLTWAELTRRAGQVAARLRATGVARGDRVAVLVDRTTTLPVALLGAWWAGAAYVPLDASYPAARIAQVLEDGGVRAIVADAPSVDRAREALHGVAVPLLELDDATWWSTPEPADALVLPGHDDVAYVIFTSGSTGRPKGVAVPHRALTNFLASMAERPGLARGDALVAVTTIAFDIAGLELWLPLTTGARVVLASRETALDGAALAARFDRTAREVAPARAVLQATPATWRLLLEAGWRGAPNVVMLCGGEGWPEGLAAALLPCGAELWNVYGPTETTIWSARLRVESPELSLGEPIANTTLHVLDPRGVPVPIGVPGELWIGGAGLAVGYVGRDDLTAERFVEQPGLGRLYRTGDRVRRLESGRIVFLGRIDDQVKLRGHRIELGEIEHALASVPGVLQAVAAVQRVGGGGEPQLVGYVVLDGAADEATVRQAVHDAARAALPEYMVPRLLVRLAAMPLTPNGKVNRRALPAPDAAAALEAPYVAPRTPLEAQVAGIWREVLGRERVGADDDFFAVGGHSLLAMRVVARLASACGVRLSIGAMFEARTVAGLAALVERRRDAGALGDAAPIPCRAPSDDAPLSLAQEPLWLFEQVQPGTATYNVPIVRRLRGELDEAALARALDAVVAAHAALRTSFTERDGEPRQRVVAHVDVPLERVDLRPLPADARAAAREAALRAAAQRPFDLRRAPLVRALFVRESDDACVVALVLHHAICDGASISVLLDDWATAYAEAAAGREARVPAPAVGMDDVAAWERATITEARLEADLAFWRDALAGAPAGIALPTDRPRTAAKWGPGARVTGTMPRVTRDGVRALALAHGATPYMVLLAAVHALLHRYAAQATTVIGTPQARRERAIATPLVRADIGPDTTFAALVAAMRRATLDATEHGHVPTDRLLRALGGEAAADGAPFDVLFALQDGIGAQRAFGPLAVESMGADLGAAKFDLSITIVSTDDGFRAVVDYRADLFDASTIERFLGHLNALVDGACADPNRAVDALPLLSGAERAQLLALAAGPTPQAVGLPFLDAGVRDAIAAHPGAIAVEQGSARLTYAALGARAGAIAAALQERGVGRGHVVAVLLERSPDLAATLLAILATGAAYLPVDTDYPADRFAYMLGDSGATVVVTTAALASHATAPVLLVESIDGSHARPLPDTLGARDGEDPAYIIYTSGSTGTPKGVVVPHRAIVNHMRWMARVVPLGPEGAVLQKTPVSFDASVWEFWAPLLAGARLVMAAPGAHRDPLALVDEVRRAGITDLQLVPSVLAEVVEVPAFAACTSLRRVFAGGEALPAALVRRVLALLDVEVHNLYGPAEATIDATSWSATRASSPDGEIVPIGRPIDHLRTYVLGPDGEPCPVGVWGELWIGGAGVALGYHRRPELTAERFVRDPFDATNARAYRTGDRVRWRPDGQLEFGGRFDTQVKLHGVRIELSEVEAALCDVDGVAAAAADV
ncbi:MAG: amino acid adenylation domain-containing protein, partial [Gemmatimonadetes bacterium]|nr:amino acid adenylation domain-containing protein [Gemmatimonadota bacterium]